MSDRESGILPEQAIKAVAAEGHIRCSKPINADQCQPASLDLRLGKCAYRIRASFLAGSKRKVLDRLSEFQMHRFSLEDGAVLERGCVYLVPLQERLRLPKEIRAVANAKSSTGRLDLLTRLIVDNGIEFDRIEAGYEGRLYAEICPRSFSVLVRTGSRLNQIRFCRGDATLTDVELADLNKSAPLASGEVRIDGGLAFSVDLDRGSGPVGYRAKPHTGVIDVDLAGAYEPDEFWEPVHASGGNLILDPGSFYILVSREAVIIPPSHAAEMMPYIAMVGEFRVHYAGFFDPGFGYSASGGEGSRGVLEVRCHEAPFLLEHGQLVGKLVFERMMEPPCQPYGEIPGSNYQGQGLKLSKHFKPQFRPTTR